MRCTIAHDTYDEIAPTLDALRAGGIKFARKPKDRFSKPTGVGYRDILLNVTFPNGHVGEVQLHVKRMTQAKIEGHHQYEISRVLEEKRDNGGVLSSEEEKALKDSLEAQIEIYGKAWQDMSGAEASMTKGFAMSAATHDFFEKDNATFRRAKGKNGMSVDDVFDRKTRSWSPYTGDRLAPALFGDAADDPLASNDN